MTQPGSKAPGAMRAFVHAAPHHPGSAVQRGCSLFLARAMILQSKIITMYESNQLWASALGLPGGIAIAGIIGSIGSR